MAKRYTTKQSNIMVVRPIDIMDSKEIARLYIQSANYLRSLGDSTEILFTEEIYLRDGFGDSRAFHGIVVEADRKLLGYLLYNFGYDTDRALRYMFVVDLLVDEKVRGFGIGKKLMKHASLICKEMECSEMQWAVFLKNNKALKFYKRLGAETVNDLVLMSLKV
jgi:GNAT superfamily N-acetyltransferase